MNPSSLFEVHGVGVTLLALAGVLVFILVISFRFRATVFCQYLKAMTGVELKPRQVSGIFKKQGKDGVREMFLDLIIKQDLSETGPLQIPKDLRAPEPGRTKSKG
ncbi:MAG TPA: hypothetical protein VFZ57_07635 [Thermoanaerobaculia bacterium]|nr:hypothetical protein [Thermoanaerobaculia bacterium]